MADPADRAADTEGPTSGTGAAPRPPDPSRDPTAVSWVREHQAGLWRYLRMLGCAEDRTEDLLQEALLAGLHHGLTGWERPRAAAWLRTTARNLYRMHLRAARRRPESADLQAVEAAWHVAHGDADGGAGARDALRACLQTLDDRDRRAVHLRYRDHASRAAMAAELDLSEPGVKALLRRIRSRLRQCVERRLAGRADDGGAR